jgi:hypothetical protein
MSEVPLYSRDIALENLLVDGLTESVKRSVHEGLALRARNGSRAHPPPHRAQRPQGLPLPQSIWAHHFPPVRYSSQFKNNHFAEMRSSSEVVSYLRLIDLCITRLQAEK